MSSIEPTAGPPKGVGPMQRREARLAYGMLAPTFLIVATIVLIPLIANFWISFKPVQLGDLRPPTPVASERVRGDATAAGDRIRIEYRLRNSSQERAITDVVMTDSWADGLTPVELDPRCAIAGQNLRCDLGSIEGGFRERLKIDRHRRRSLFGVEN